MGPGAWNPIWPTAVPPSPPDPMAQPLPVAAPPTWKEREDRVRWCFENLTNGEHALLYKVLYDYGFRRDQCVALIEKERKTCSS